MRYVLAALAAVLCCMTTVAGARTRALPDAGVIKYARKVKVMSSKGWTRETELAGRTVTCDGGRIVWDPKMTESEAAATVTQRGKDGTIWLSPRLLAKWEPEGQWFIFAHECGHTNGNDSEDDADLHAIKRGLREGWLTEGGIAHICKKMRYDPASRRGHSSGRQRCKNFKRWYAKYKPLIQVAPPPAPTVAPHKEPPQPPLTPPRKPLPEKPWWAGWSLFF